MLARTEPRVRVLCAQSLKRKSALWNNFNRVDFRIFDVAGEGDGELPIRHFHRHGFDVGAVRAAGLGKNVKIFERVPLHSEGKNALASPGHAVVGQGPGQDLPQRRARRRVEVAGQHGRPLRALVVKPDLVKRPFRARLREGLQADLRYLTEVVGEWGKTYSDGNNSSEDEIAAKAMGIDVASNKLLAFVIVFVVVTVAASIVTQGAYRRTELSADHPIIDDIFGGLLGLLQGVLVLLFVVIILNSYTLPAARPGDLTYLRTAQDIMANQSHIAIFFRDHVAPAFMHSVSFLIPSDLVSLFP